MHKRVRYREAPFRHTLADGLLEEVRLHLRLGGGVEWGKFNNAELGAIVRRRYSDRLGGRVVRERKPGRIRIRDPQVEPLYTVRRGTEWQAAVEQDYRLVVGIQARHDPADIRGRSGGG